MASNPMQRKSRNSFLLGIIVTLLITGVIIAFLLLALKQKNDKIKEEETAKVNVYVLTQNVKAAQTLTSDMFTIKSVNKNTIPSNATSLSSVIDSWFLQTKEGEKVCRDDYGLYLNRAGEKTDVIMEIQKHEGTSELKDLGGNKISTGDYYVEVEETLVKVNPTSSSIRTDDYGTYYIDTTNTEQIRVYKEKATDEYYMYKIDSTTNARVKEYLNIKNVPVLARVDMNSNTVITPELVVQSSEIITDDTRTEEYNMLVLPVDLMTDEYIDIRFLTPNGQNFIVVSKARVEVPMNADDTYVVDTIKVNLREDEILAMSSAIVEAYGLKGSKLYVTKYADPAMQESAVPTYTPNAAVTAQIQSNPNIVEIASKELAARYSDAAKKARNEYLQKYIDSVEIDKYNSNIQSGMEEDIGTSITTRKKYLDSLGY